MNIYLLDFFENRLNKIFGKDLLAMEFSHISVLLDETVEKLNIDGDGIIVDGTLGGGGHTELILKKYPKANVIGIDRDIEAINASKKRLEPYLDRITFVNDNYSNIKAILADLKTDKIDGAVLDLGVSSYQLDNAQRGFSYMNDAKLDMRMNSSSEKTAYDVVNNYSESELRNIFYKYGEEKWSARIAEFIVNKRSINPIETTFELNEIIKAAIPKKAREKGGHPSKRIFQAIRIEVNDEISLLKPALYDFADSIKSGGVMCVITFHSLEDRIVKNVFKDLAAGCCCPKEFPVCVCGKVPLAKNITGKPIIPSDEEIKHNSRSKSAKLRAIQKL